MFLSTKWTSIYDHSCSKLKLTLLCFRAMPDSETEPVVQAERTVDDSETESDYEAERTVDDSETESYVEALMYYFLPWLFNPNNGICCWVPVEFVDQSGVYQKLVAMSIVMLVWWYSEKGVQAAETRSFFRSPSNFARYPRKLGREDFLKVMLKTPFRPYALGSADKPNSMAKNEESFVFVEYKAFQEVLRKCTNRFPVQELEIKKKAPGRAGQSYAFRQDLSISELGGLEIKDSDRKTIPSSGVPWWKELMTPVVIEMLKLVPFDEVDVKPFDEIAPSVRVSVQEKHQQIRKAKAARNKRKRQRLRQKKQTSSS